MKRASNDQIVIGAELIEAAFLECPVEDQASSLVDDHKSEYSPSNSQYINTRPLCMDSILHVGQRRRPLVNMGPEAGFRTDGR